MEKMMSLIRKIFDQYKEVILYLFFGGLTFIVSMSTYILFLWMLNDNALIANVISWIFAVAFAYITNRIWVFHSKTSGAAQIVKEILSFFGGRIATLLLEEAILYVGIYLLGINNIVIKVLAQIVVIIGNYVISKLFVFKNHSN